MWRKCLISILKIKDSGIFSLGIWEPIFVVLSVFIDVETEAPRGQAMCLGFRVEARINTHGLPRVGGEG